VVGLGALASHGLVIALLLLLVVIGAVALTSRPYLLGALVLSAVPATSGLLRGGILPVVKISEALVLFSGVFVLVLRPSYQRLRWSRLDTSVAAFAVVSLVLGVAHIPGDPQPLASALRVVLRPALLFVIYRVVAAGISNAHQLRRALRWALVLTVPVSSLTILQYANVPGIRTALINAVGSPGLMPVATKHGSVRATGPFPIWHSLDGYLLPFVLLAIALLLESGQTVLRRRWLVLIVAMDCAALVTSLTLAVGIGLVLGVLILGFLYRRTLRILAVMGAAAAAATLLFLPALQLRYEQQFGTSSSVSTSSTPQTLSYRLQIWHDQFLPVIEAHPVLGYANHLPPDAAFQHTDNEYLTLLLRGGVPLVLAAGVMVVGVAAGGARLSRDARSPEARALGRAVAAAAVCPVLMGVVWPYITNAGFGEAWLGLAGAVRAMNRGSGRRARLMHSDHYVFVDS
jgi:O-antigen ligase